MNDKYKKLEEKLEPVEPKYMEKKILVETFPDPEFVTTTWGDTPELAECPKCGKKTAVYTFYDVGTHKPHKVCAECRGPVTVSDKASFWDRAKLSLVRGATFDFLRHFLIGFVGIGGTAIATTGNLGWAVVAGVAGGLVEGGRKVWSGSTAKQNGGTKNRLLKAIIELVLAIIEKLLTKRKEARDGD